jgi:hypothetical protein
MAFLNSVIRRHGPDRVRVLSSETLLAQPARALLKLSHHFDLNIGVERASEIATGPVFRQHAKSPFVPFDANAHHAQNNGLDAAHASEIAVVKQWAIALARQCNAPLALPDTLFD